MFIGSLCTKEDLIIGLAVLLANIFAGLGGCWWPIEIVPLGRPHGGHDLARLLGHGRPAQAAVLPGRVRGHPAEPGRPARPRDRPERPRRPLLQDPGLISPAS
ncbi:MAG: hypothetical protein MZU84_08450 [Sphingobacterium sp.]|nr:hypothetical protein [Sphingobacterium sp.]